MVQLLLFSVFSIISIFLYYYFCSIILNLLHREEPEKNKNKTPQQQQKPK